MLATKNDSQTCVIFLVFFFFGNVFVFYQFSFTMSKKNQEFICHVALMGPNINDAGTM
jgi:hypothetical protein